MVVSVSEEENRVGPLLAALADPTRRAIYEALVRQPKVVADIAADMPVSRPAVSQHLKVLKMAGLVEEQRMGRQVQYRALTMPLNLLSDYMGGLGAAPRASDGRGHQAEDAIDRAMAGWAEVALRQDPATAAMIARFRLLSLRLQRMYAETAATYGLNIGEAMILGTLRRTADRRGFTPGELARASVILPPGIAKRLVRLEHLGLICRVSNSQDRRSHRVQLTTKGADVADAITEEQFGRKYAPIFALPAAQRDAVDQTLRRLLKDFHLV